MKILHMADLHFGAKNSRLPRAQQDILKEEGTILFSTLMEETKDRYDVALICGDLFHSKNVPLKIVNSFFKAIEKFEKPVLYIEGNHDDKFILPEKLPSNFVVLNEECPFFSLEEVIFYCTKNLPKDLDKAKTNILLAHGHIENTLDNDYFDINKYLLLGFDYIALGHVHQIKKYKKGEHIFAYSGSLFSNGFDEQGEKGFLSIEIKNKNVLSCNFMPLTQRKYCVVNVDISGLDNTRSIYKKIEEELRKNNVTKRDIVKIVLIGEVEEDCEKSLTILQDKLSEQFYIEIEDKSNLKLNIEDIKKEKLSLKYEFIALLENDNSLEEELKRDILNLGLKALKGEDFSL